MWQLTLSSWLLLLSIAAPAKHLVRPPTGPHTHCRPADLIDREAARAWDCGRQNHMINSGNVWINAMRFIFALGMLIVLCAPAGAAGVHHFKPRPHVFVRPSQGLPAGARFAVPGWTDEQTRYWLDRGPSACAGCG